MQTECLYFCRLFSAELAGVVKEEVPVHHKGCRSSAKTKSSLIQRVTTQEFRDECKTLHLIFFFFVDIERQLNGNKVKERYKFVLRLEMMLYWEISMC